MEVEERVFPGNSRLVPQRGHLYRRILQTGRKANPLSRGLPERPRSSLQCEPRGNTRAIDIHKDDAIEETAFKQLIRAAVAFNVAKRKE